MPRHRLRSHLAWSAIFTVAACNAIWGIDEGKLAESDGVLAGAPATEPGGAPPIGGNSGASGADAGESAGGVSGGAPAGGQGGEATPAGGTHGGTGAASGSGGALGGGGSTAGSPSGGSGAGGGGGGATCSGCKAGDVENQSQACGRCGTGSQSRSRTCGANCTWGAWSGWSTCSQCDVKQYRCCGAGKWEWCYDSDCAWTNDCAACSASSCPEC